MGFAPHAVPTARTAARLADAAGDIAVRCRRAGRNGAQRRPDLMLEGRAAHVERQIEALARRLDEGDDLGDQLAEVSIAADQLGAREAVAQFVLEHLGSSPSMIEHTPLSLAATSDRAPASMSAVA